MKKPNPKGFGIKLKRRFNPEALLRDGLAARNEIKHRVADIAKKILGDRLTEDEAETIGEEAAKVSVKLLLGNHKVMRHVADARTSRTQSVNKDGKFRELLPSQQRAVAMARDGALAKTIPDLLESEGLAKIGKDGSILLSGMDRKIPASSWESSLSRWKNK